MTGVAYRNNCTRCEQERLSSAEPDYLFEDLSRAFFPAWKVGFPLI
jgi:hypothetical protein